MKTLIIFVIVLFICSLYLTKTKINQEDNVLILTGHNFNQAINEYNYLFVIFYEPGCEHCDAIESEYKKVADTLNKEQSEIRVGSLDVMLNPKLAKKYKIEGSPTIKFFVNQTAIAYAGTGQADDMLSWIKKKSILSPVPISSSIQLEQFKANYDLVALGLFKNLENENALIYKNVSNSTSFETILFTISSNQEFFKNFKIKNDQAIILFRNFNNDQVALEGIFDQNKLTSFLKVNRLPDVVEFNPRDLEIIFDSTYTIHNVLLISKRSKKFNESMNEFQKAAKHFKERVMFVLLNIDNQRNKKSIKTFKVNINDTPTYRLVKSPHMIRYKPHLKDIKADNIIEFVQNCLDKKIKPDLLSESLPDDWNAQPLKVLAGINFQSVAKDKTKSVLVLFYASWDDKSKELLPIVEQLAINFQNRSEYLVAKIDCTINEFEDFRIEDLPTIKLFPKNSDEYIIFKNAQTLDNLSLFLESHGKNDNLSKKDEL